MARKFWMLSVGICLSCTTSIASAITYDLSPFSLPSGFSVAGTIETDGTIGTLTEPNLVNWSITITGDPTFTITPANSSTNSGIFRDVTATPDQLQVAFPDGVLQFNFIPPFTTTVAACSDCGESSISIARFDFGRNSQGVYLEDNDDPAPDIDVTNAEVVASGETLYVAATRAAIQPTSPTAVPTLPFSVLAIMGGFLALLAMRKLRKV